MSEIQELIKKFKASEDKDMSVYAQIVKQIKTTDKLWAAYSPVTRNYHLDILKGKVIAFIFSEKEYYDLYEERVKAKNIKIQPSESSAEKRIELFSELARSGFDLIIVDNGQDFLVMDIFDIIQKQDYSLLPENKRPVVNPKLVAAANDLFTAISLGKSTPDKEHRLFKEMYNARFLIPVEIDTKIKKKDYRKDAKFRVPLITNEKDQKFFPIFTDINELKRMDKENKFDANVIRFDDLEYFVKLNDGIAINPFGFNLILNNELVTAIKKVGEEKEPESETIRISNDDDVILANPEKYPEQMVKRMKNSLVRYKDVKSAYIMLMTKEEKEFWTIAVDYSGDVKPLFDMLGQAAMPTDGGRPVAFVPLNSALGKKIEEQSEPFYKAE